RIVRQDWTNWNLSGVFPMIYHGFYNEHIHWIGTAVAEGVEGIEGKFRLYAGLFLPDFNSVEEVRQAAGLAKDNGACGITLFGDSDFDTATIDLLRSFR